jgi:hypothetical protein
MILVAALVVSCSESPSRYDNGIPVSIEVPLLAASGLEQLVETVELLIYADDLETMAFDLDVIQGKVSTTVEVPPGSDRIFEMRAADATGRVLYFGADTVSISQGLDEEVHIILRPVILLMRISPNYQEVEVGTPTTVDIHIFNVDSLYGAAFVLIFDPHSIRIDGWGAGGLLGDDEGTIFRGHLEGDSLAISYTRTGDVYSTGVSGSGRLATITLTPLVQGSTDLELRIHSRSALGKPDQSPVDRIDELVLDGATIIGRGVE